MSSNIPSFPTSLGTSEGNTITLLGQDLAHDLMGQVSFGELAYWLITLERPTPQQTRLFETVLLRLADHGVTPTAQRGPPHLPERARRHPGRAGRGPARRRLALPGRHRGHRPVPGRR